jgi:hypothetical protein
LPAKTGFANLLFRRNRPKILLDIIFYFNLIFFILNFLAPYFAQHDLISRFYTTFLQHRIYMKNLSLLSLLALACLTTSQSYAAAEAEAEITPNGYVRTSFSPGLLFEHHQYTSPDGASIYKENGLIHSGVSIFTRYLLENVDGEEVLMPTEQMWIKIEDEQNNVSFKQIPYLIS